MKKTNSVFGGRPVYWLLLLVLMGTICLYGEFLVRPALENYSGDDTFAQIANIHDHNEYSGAFQGLADGDDGGESSGASSLNVRGIATIYLGLSLLSGSLDVEAISLVFNLLAVLAAAVFHLKICNALGLSRRAQLLFFLNLPLIYFSQLVGKDAIYTAILYALAYNYIRGRLVWMFLIAGAGMFVRTQLPLLVLMLAFYQRSRLTTREKFLTLYLVSSVLGAIAFTRGGVLGAGADLGSGVTAVVNALNQSVFIGNLLLNPVRVAQYLAEFLYLSLKALADPANFSGLFQLPFLVFFAKNFSDVCRVPRKVRRNVLTQFFLINLLFLLIVPIINLRYFMVMLPFAALAIAYERRLRAARRRSAAIRLLASTGAETPLEAS